MLDAQINLFDAIVIGIVGISALLSFFRGFVREILSLGAWVGAAVITLYSFPGVARMLKEHIDSTAVASGLAAMGTFMITLFVISIFNAIIVRYMKKGSDVGLLDNTLGLFFGVFRGALLVSLGYFVLTLVMSEQDYPGWIRNAQTRGMVENGALMVARIAPDYLDELSPLAQSAKQMGADLDPGAEIPGGAEGEGGILQRNFKKDRGGIDDVVEGKGYDWMSVKELERLIQNTSDEAVGGAKDMLQGGGQ